MFAGKIKLAYVTFSLPYFVFSPFDIVSGKQKHSSVWPQGETTIILNFRNLGVG